MIEGDDRGVAMLVALESIRRLAVDYAYAVDQFEIDRLVSLWLPDGEFDERLIGGDLLVGRDAIRQKFDRDFTAREASGHFVTNHVIDLAGPGAASGTCYAIVDADLADGTSLHASVRYADRYRFDGHRWHIESRVVSLLKSLDVG